MKSRPLYNKLYQDLIREKYPDRESDCSAYLEKKNWTALDVIQVENILFADQQKKSKKKSNQKHRA